MKQNGKRTKESRRSLIVRWSLGVQCSLLAYPVRSGHTSCMYVMAVASCVHALAFLALNQPTRVCTVPVRRRSLTLMRRTVVAWV